MNLPDKNDLDDMAQLVGNLDFDQLGPESRVQIIQLVNQCDVIDGLAEIKDALGNLDHELTKVGDWFKASRTYDGSN